MVLSQICTKKHKISISQKTKGTVVSDLQHISQFNMA